MMQNVYWSSSRVPFILVRFSRHIFEKHSNTNLMKIRPVGAELFHKDLRTDRQTWQSS